MKVVPASMFAALMAFGTASAQDLTSLRIGDRIRVTDSVTHRLVGASASPTETRTQGRLEFLTPSAITVRNGGTLRTANLADLSLLEVGHRTSRSVARSIGRGLVGGMALGSLLGLTGETNTGDGIITVGDKISIGSVLGGMAGLFGGAIHGICCSSTWRPVALR